MSFRGEFEKTAFAGAIGRGLWGAAKGMGRAAASISKGTINAIKGSPKFMGDVGKASFSWGDPRTKMGKLMLAGSALEGYGTMKNVSANTYRPPGTQYTRI